MPGSSPFDRVFVLNLDRRPDRLGAFYASFSRSGWPYGYPERFRALDGRLCPKPAWYKWQAGAWGSRQTRTRLLEQALNEGWDSLCWFEDDAIFAPDFAERIGPFMAAVPDDWDLIYFGGQVRYAQSHPPDRMNDLVLRPYACTGLYAVAMRRPLMERAYGLFVGRDDALAEQVFAKASYGGQANVYIPSPWLVGHAPGASDTCSRYYGRAHFWNHDPAAPTEKTISHLMQPIHSVRISGGRVVGERRLEADPAGGAARLGDEVPVPPKGP